MTPSPTPKVKAGPVNGDPLKRFADRIDRLEEEKKTTSGGIRDVYAEAKSAGYNTKALRKVLAERRRKSDAELEADMEAYRAALGEPGATYRSAAKQLGMTKSKLHRLVPRNQNGTDDGRPHGDSATVAGDETVAPAVPVHDPETGEVLAAQPSTETPAETQHAVNDPVAEITPANGAAETAKPEGPAAPTEDTEFPGQEPNGTEGRRNSGDTLPAPPISSCGGVEGHAGRLLAPEDESARCEQSGADETLKDRKSAGTPAMAASGTAGVESGPQDTPSAPPSDEAVIDSMLAAKDRMQSLMASKGMG